MSRHAVARLLLTAVIAVTLLVGLGTVGRAAYTAHQPAAVATMAVLIGLFAVAVVVWAHAEPTARVTESAATDETAVFGTVGLVWPGGEPAAADAVDVWPGTEWWHAADTEPILFTHEFISAHDFDAELTAGTGPTAAEINCVRDHLGLPQLSTAAHDGGDAASVHVRDLLRREGFDGGLSW